MKVSEIFETIGKTLGKEFPKISRHAERVKTLKPPAFSLELVDYDVSTYEEKTVFKSLTLDLIYYSPKNTVMEGVEMIDRLTALFLPAFAVGERWLKPKLEEARMVDQDLHFILTFPFYDGMEHVVFYEDAETKRGEPDLATTNVRNVVRDIGLMKELFVNLKTNKEGS